MGNCNLKCMVINIISINVDKNKLSRKPKWGLLQ